MPPSRPALRADLLALAASLEAGGLPRAATWAVALSAGGPALDRWRTLTGPACPAMSAFVSPGQLLDHWQGHRTLTRRVIEAFPEASLFAHAVGGMRPFGTMALEVIEVSGAVVRGLATGEWASGSDRAACPKAEVLRRWDAVTAEIDRTWGAIPPERFQEEVTSFGRWTGPGYWHVLYAVDNEVHHRAQGYVYLRSLGVAPPPFHERGGVR